MKNWSKRVVVVAVAALGVISITANIVQYRKYVDLRDLHAESRNEYTATISEKNAEIEEKDSVIAELQKDLAGEERIQKILEADLDEIMDATLAYSKELAAEAGFDPDAQDWIYGGNGKWYFFTYDF